MCQTFKREQPAIFLQSLQAYEAGTLSICMGHYFLSPFKPNLKEAIRHQIQKVNLSDEQLTLLRRLQKTICCIFNLLRNHQSLDSLYISTDVCNTIKEAIEGAPDWQTHIQAFRDADTRLNPIWHTLVRPSFLVLPHNALMFLQIKRVLKLLIHNPPDNNNAMERSDADFSYHIQHFFQSYYHPEFETVYTNLFHNNNVNDLFELGFNVTLSSALLIHQPNHIQPLPFIPPISDIHGGQPDDGNLPFFPGNDAFLQDHHDHVDDDSLSNVTNEEGLLSWGGPGFGTDDDVGQSSSNSTYSNAALYQSNVTHGNADLHTYFANEGDD